MKTLIIGLLLLAGINLFGATYNTDFVNQNNVAARGVVTNIAQATLVQSNLQWIAALNGKGANQTNSASSTTASPLTLQAKVGSTANTFQIIPTNSADAIPVCVDSNNVLHAYNSVIIDGFDGSYALYSDANKKIQESAASDTELGYLSGVTSALQTQLNAKAPYAATTPGSNAVARVNGFANSLTSTGQTSIGPHQFISTNGSNGLQLSATGSVTMLVTFKPANGSNSPLVLSASPTQTPQITLATNGNVNFGTGTITLNNGGGGSGISFANTSDNIYSVGSGNSANLWLLGGSGDNYIQLKQGVDGRIGFGNSGDSYIARQGVGILALTNFQIGNWLFASNSSVGIGTTTPLEKLHVTNGVIRTDGGIGSYATNATITVGSTGVTNTLTVCAVVSEFAGTTVTQTHADGTTLSRGSITTGIDIVLQPGAKLTGTACSSAGNLRAW